MYIQLCFFEKIHILKSINFKFLDAILPAIWNNDVGPQKSKLQQEYFIFTDLEQHFCVWKPVFTTKRMPYLKYTNLNI